VKVQMVWQMSGTRGDGQDWPDPGGPIDLPVHEARSLIERGAAVPLVEERAVETAVAPVDPAVEERAVEAPAAPSPGGYVPNAEPEPEPDPEPVRRGPGRPPGSPNKPK
jgi:hypothetical protein